MDTLVEHQTEVRISQPIYQVRRGLIVDLLIQQLCDSCVPLNHV